MSAEPNATAGSAGTSPVPARDELLDLPKGKAYQTGGAAHITSRSLTRVVLFAGTASSGKTSLLTSLYLRLQRGPIDGWMFAGSETLVGFEQRAHNALLASRLSEPKIERTKVSELLHIRVRKLEQPTGVEMLLCDLSGEDFRDARDTTEGCRRLVVVRRADSFVLLVDGAKLSSPEFRQQAKNDPIALLRNILDCGMLPETAHVDVLTTKWDLVSTSDDREQAERFDRHIQSEIRRHFSSRVGSMGFHRVAAIPQRPEFSLAEGVDELFSQWLARRPGAARRRVQLEHDLAEASQYDRYLAGPRERRTRSLEGAAS